MQRYQSLRENASAENRDCQINNDRASYLTNQRVYAMNFIMPQNNKTTIPCAIKHDKTIITTSRHYIL